MGGSGSYKRRCNVPGCGKWIQMRQMPAGQWVAFEGWDTVHEHAAPGSRPSLPRSSSDRPSISKSYRSASAPPPSGNPPRATTSASTGGCLLFVVVLSLLTAASFVAL